jgi:hypothetical protein
VLAKETIPEKRHIKRNASEPEGTVADRASIENLLKNSLSVKSIMV